MGNSLTRAMRRDCKRQSRKRSPFPTTSWTIPARKLPVESPAPGMISLPTGSYTVVIQATGKPITIPDVRIHEKGTTKVELKKEGEEVGVKVLGR